MSVVRYINYENRLAKQVIAPGGKQAETALADAEESLKSMAEACVAEIDDRLRMLSTLSDRSGRTPQPDEIDQFYGHAREIAGLAGICGMDEVGVAAHSLCALLDHSRGTGRWHAEGIRVHMATLHLLRDKGDQIDPQARTTVLKRLEIMVEKVAGGA